MSFVGSFQMTREYSEKNILAYREIVPNYQFSKYLGFSVNRIRNLDRTKAKIDHTGCINIVKWDQHGHGFITGSDDRELKYWSITNDVEEVILKNSIRTRHRSNIFYADFDRVDENIYYSCAADGTLRSSHALQRNVGELLRSSDDIIHMFHIDQDQPKVIYTAEEAGSIYRIDLRTGHSDKIFQHTKHVYKACQRNNPLFQLVPEWSTDENAVKAVIQNHTYSTPHLIVGGQGYMTGLLDLRLASYPQMHVSDAGGDSTSAISSFVKLWCPMFPMNTNSHDYEDCYHSCKYSSLSHPYGTSTNHPLVEGDFKLAFRKHVFTRAHQTTSTSGLDVSKDGQRLLVSFQGDQIYTFDFYDESNNNCLGCRAFIGGHCNYATFLKSVRFFGPKDEYVVAGSDTGHMWIWSSSPKFFITSSACGDSKVPLGVISCPVWNILKADSRTCNGVAPHPSELLLVSYGIDSSAKLWAVRNLDIGDKKAEETITVASGRKISSAPSTYPFCRHDGPHDRSRYSRISVSKTLASQPKSPFCALALLPYLLEETKKNLDMVFPEFLNYPKLKNMVLSPSDYVSCTFVIRESNSAILFNASNSEPNVKQYYEDDRGPFMPSDALHCLFRNGIPIKDISDYIFGTVKKWPTWSNKPNAFWHHLFRRFYIISIFRFTSMMELSMDYFLYLHYRGLDNNRSKLFNFFFLPVLSLTHLAEEAKTNGSRAFRNKDYDYAHHFYCKAQRYIEFIFSLGLVPALSSLTVKDNIPMESLSQWTIEKRMKQIPRPIYDINVPAPVVPQTNPLNSTPILNRKLRSRLTRRLQAMGVPFNQEIFRLLGNAREATSTQVAPSVGVSSSPSSSAAAVSGASTSDPLGTTTASASIAMVNEREEESVSSYYTPGAGRRLSPIQEGENISRPLPESQHALSVPPSDASATSWTTVTETNVSGSSQETVTSTSMAHEDDEEEDNEDEDEDDEYDEDDDGDSELGLMRRGEIEFDSDEDEELLGEETTGLGVANRQRSSRINEQLDAIAGQESSAKASKSKNKKEGKDTQANIDSDIDDNALEGNMVRFILHSLSECPMFLRNHEKELYKMQRFRCINRRYWRKVTLHPHGPNRLVRGDLSPTSSANNSEGESEMCFSSSNNDDESTSHETREPEKTLAADIGTTSQSNSPSTTTDKAQANSAATIVGCNSPFCCCCGSKDTYPSPELKDLLSEYSADANDAENDALILADDCESWFDKPFIYDPVWRNHHRLRMKSTSSLGSDKKSLPPEKEIVASDNCDADDEGDDMDGLRGKDIPDQKRRRLGSPSTNTQSPSLLCSESTSSPSAETNVTTNNINNNNGDSKTSTNTNTAAATIAVNTEGNSSADNNQSSCFCLEQKTSAKCKSKPDHKKEEIRKAISNNYLKEITAHKNKSKEEIDNFNEKIRFETKEDFLLWGLSPQFGQYLHKQAYELMKYIYDEHLVSLMMTVYSNLAATFIAMEKFVDAKHVCEDAFKFARILDLSGNQIDAKLYFRRAVCYLHLHMYEEAVRDLQEAAALQPKDLLIANKLKEAKRLQENKRKTEIRAYSRMFGDGSS